MPKIVIIGAGISGLSCAYDLITRGFDVEIYERSDTFGGQAKSLKTNNCYVPYAWRIWTNHYYNFLDIVKNIPYEKGTVRDNIVNMPKYTHELQNTNGRQISGGKTLQLKNFKSPREYLKLINKLGNALLFSDKRLKHNDITFYDYIDPKEKATEDFIMEFVGPIIGMEAKKATLFSVVKGWEITYISRSIQNGMGDTEIYVANGPYSEVIFNPWVEYLKKLGVKIYTNCNIETLNYDKYSNKVSSIDIENRGRVYADDFIMCIDQTALVKLLKPNKELMKMDMFNNSTKLMQYGNEMYFGMVLYFSEKFDPPLGTGCVQEQPWKVVIENYASSWNKKFVNHCGAAEIIQASCLDLNPGLYGKMLHECSVEEAVNETIDQLKLGKLTKDLKTITGKSIWDVFIGYDVWPDWVNGDDGKITNKNGVYKFSINKHCWKNMPTTKTNVQNLYFGSVVTKTEVPMVSMEMASTNGRHAAKAISEKYKVKPAHIYTHPGFLPIILSPYRAIDYCLFSIGIHANMLKVSIMITILLLVLLIYTIVCLVIRKMKKRKN